MADDSSTSSTMADDPTSTEPSSSTPSRLMITKLELENFKSYAGVKTIGEFHQCFSSVVGPNGSGKSNVIDAMLFVFGKRAKKLRLNKVSELIHKSDQCSDATFARVSVYFQEIIDTDNGGFDILPNTEISITRIAKKDNSSTYKMNGRNCQFKDVASFLNQKGIDLDNNRFLILQGEVEMISMMPPKGKNEGDEGLLEYLEDIIGSSKFVQQTEEAAELVEQLSEQRQEKLNRVKAVEKEKDNLQDAKQEAEQLLKKDREIRSKQNVLYQIKATRLASSIEIVQADQKEAEQKLSAEREQLESADGRIQQLESDLKTQQKSYNKIHDELVTTKEQFSAYERRDIKIREELKHQKTLKKKLTAKVTAKESKSTESLEKKQAAEDSIPQLEEQIEELTTHKAKQDEKLQAIHDEMKGVTQQLRSELEAKTQELAPVQQERAVYQGALDTAETEVKLLEDGVNLAKEKLEKAETELENLDSKQEDKRQELVSTEDELARSKDRIQEAVAEEKKLAKREEQLSQKNTQLKASIEESKAAMESTGGPKSSPAVQGILKAARKGGELAKAGVLGRLGDLGCIPDEYDVAISTAGGPKLNTVVTLTTAGTQKCLEFLRKHNLGRANFIPLDKLPKAKHDNVVETPENAPRLFDLIQPARPNVSPALYWCLANTLVAPDLQTATRWAYEFKKRWRVVTMGGEMVETSGTMAGGGKSVKRGGMKLQSGRKTTRMDVDDSMDTKELEVQAEQVQTELNDCRSRRKELVGEIRDLKKQVKKLETKLPKLTVEISGCDTTREELTKFIPELRSQCELGKEDAKKLKALKSKVAKCKTDMSSCTIRASKLENDVARLQKAIMDAGGSKLKKQQASCDKALANLNTAEKALKTAKVSISSMEKAAAKAQKEKAAAETELEICLAKTAELQTEFKSLETDAIKVVQEFERVKMVEAEAREELDKATAEVDKLKQSQNKAKLIEVELIARIEGYKKTLKELNHKSNKWESELDKLRAAAAEDDEFDFSDDEDDEDSESSSKGSDDVEMEEPEVSPNETTTKEPNKESPISSSKNGLPVFSPEALEQYDKEQIANDIGILETERNTIAKNANMGAIAEYRKKEEAYLSRVSELDAVTEERNKARQTHEDLRRQRLDMFMDGFGQITLKLKEMYQMITLGGDAELELVDSLDPFSEGIVFSVRPPKKSWKNISNLSGGEKTLSSLALVFALHHYKPTPLYVMDEIDAALDFKNVSIVANYIKERTRNAQFIIISLRNNMFELADRLVGIYKTNNCTKSVSIDPHSFGVEGQQNGHVPPTPGTLKPRNSASVILNSTAVKRTAMAVGSGMATPDG